MKKKVAAKKADVNWRLEAHIWFNSFDEYARQQMKLIELLGRIQGNGSIIVFFRKTPEYIEIPGATFDSQDEKKVSELVDFCGVENVDFVARVSRNARRPGHLRWKENTA